MYCIYIILYNVLVSVREKVYDILIKNGIQVPRFAVLKRPDGTKKHQYSVENSDLETAQRTRMLHAIYIIW